jgi:hypothetical protein
MQNGNTWKHTWSYIEQSTNNKLQDEKNTPKQKVFNLSKLQIKTQQKRTKITTV